MTSKEEFVRSVYRAAEGDIQDVDAWRNAFAEDGVFAVAGGVSFTGDELGNAVTGIASAVPDVHRELLRVNVMDNVVAIETLVHGTHLGPFPTPVGPIAPTGNTIEVPTADFIYLRDGKITTFKTYVLQNVWFAQLGVHPDFAAVVGKSADVA